MWHAVLTFPTLSCIFFYFFSTNGTPRKLIVLVPVYLNWIIIRKYIANFVIQLPVDSDIRYEKIVIYTLKWLDALLSFFHLFRSLWYVMRFSPLMNFVYLQTFFIFANNLSIVSFYSICYRRYNLIKPRQNKTILKQYLYLSLSTCTTRECS